MTKIYIVKRVAERRETLIGVCTSTARANEIVYESKVKEIEDTNLDMEEGEEPYTMDDIHKTFVDWKIEEINTDVLLEW